MSTSTQDMWNKLIESFSQSCRATAAIDMQLNCTNSLIKNSLQQLDTTSIDSIAAMRNAKLQLAILAARLTQKQSDNDALFRATAELAATNVSLQNELDNLQENQSLKSDTTQDTNEPMIQDIEAETNIDISLKQRFENARAATNQILKQTSSISVTESFEVPRQPKHISEEASISSELPPVVKDPKDALVKLFGNESDKDWSWNDQEVDKGSKYFNFAIIMYCI